MNEYLAPAELHTLTDASHASKQAAWLKDHGIPHMVDGRRIIVSRLHVQAKLEGKSTPVSSGPNWAAVA
jgi:hypothetical protein